MGLAPVPVRSLVPVQEMLPASVAAMESVAAQLMPGAELSLQVGLRIQVVLVVKALARLRSLSADQLSYLLAKQIVPVVVLSPEHRRHSPRGRPARAWRLIPQGRLMPGFASFLSGKDP